MANPPDSDAIPPEGSVPPGDAATPSATPPVPPKKRRWKLKAFIAGLLLLPVLFVAFYTLIMLNYAYSEGNRAGYLQTFARRGWLCKTYEGQLTITSVPGVAPTTWEFSVRDDDVARQLIDASGKRVVLFYEEHRGLPTDCFGATNFFVDSVVVSQR